MSIGSNYIIYMSWIIVRSSLSGELMCLYKGYDLNPFNLYIIYVNPTPLFRSPYLYRTRQLFCVGSYDSMTNMWTV